MIVKRPCIYPPKGKDRPLHIYLPEDYETSGKRYGVMYFFDGHNLFFDSDATYGKCWGLKEYLDHWGKQIILVGIECGHEGNERLNEYLPYPGEHGWAAELTPMGEQTMDWIVKEIKPMIDREYRTRPGRQYTAIGGSSMGGLMALFGILRYNAVFSKAACVSSAIGFCMGGIHAELDRAYLHPNTRIFLSWGSREAYGIRNPNKGDRHSHTYRWNRAVYDRVKQKGAKARLYCQVGGGHCEADWEQQLPLLMPYLWGK